MQLVERPMKAKRKAKAKVPSPVHRPSSPLQIATASTPETEDTPKPPSPILRREPSVSVSPEPVTIPISSPSVPASLRATYMPSAGLSPTLTEILQPFSDDVPPDEDYVSFELPEGLNLPFTPRGVPRDPPQDEDVTEDEFEDIFHNGDFDDALTFGRTNSYSPSPILTPTDMATLWQGPVTYMYHQPYFAPNSPEMLTFRFDRLTCGILSVMDGQTENPWRNLIWPLALESPALYHAVMAMTAYHSSTDVPALRVSGHEHKQASIRYIQEGIRDNSMNDQTAIATALALGFSESWDQHTASGNTHIKGAQALVKRALFEHQHNPLQGVELARLKFLCNAWVYMDVIARLTSVDSDESNDFDNTLLFATEGPNMVMGNNALSGFGIDFGMPVDARLDPLMGCANTLFPLIGRVANLVRKVCRSQTNSPGVISAAHDLKLSLETWEPPAFIEDPEDPTCNAQHALQTAEAYRWATLLHLHQSVPELPSDTSLELAQRVLQYLATVPLASRTVIVQIYPLMVAGCEAKTMEDRQWVRDRWTAMGQRMRIGVIDKSATVTEEVWRRRDAYDAQPRDRRKLVATAELQPARQRGAPLVRTDTGFRDADPGKTGMVFSYVEADSEGGGSGGSSGGGVSSIPRDERFPPRPKGPDKIMGPMDAAYTVRGHLHWVGVMWDWGWEVLLG
ncbi:hypothetical protein LTR86_003428 [Recurvomyces mirabilis]|nr:hypothetical protein LTR86_003428 [Recurvomyces mirabilis]